MDKLPMKGVFYPSVSICSRTSGPHCYSEIHSGTSHCPKNKSSVHIQITQYSDTSANEDNSFRNHIR